MRQNFQDKPKTISWAICIERQPMSDAPSWPKTTLEKKPGMERRDNVKPQAWLIVHDYHLLGELKWTTFVVGEALCLYCFFGCWRRESKLIWQPIQSQEKGEERKRAVFCEWQTSRLEREGPLGERVAPWKWKESSRKKGRGQRELSKVIILYWGFAIWGRQKRDLPLFFIVCHDYRLTPLAFFNMRSSQCLSREQEGGNRGQYFTEVLVTY